MDKLTLEAMTLDEKKAGGRFGSLIMAVVKLAEEVGMLLKLLSQAHRSGNELKSYFDTELGDLVCQVDLLCKRRGTTLTRMLRAGRERFKERLELKEKW